MIIIPDVILDKILHYISVCRHRNQCKNLRNILSNNVYKKLIENKSVIWDSNDDIIKFSIFCSIPNTSGGWVILKDKEKQKIFFDIKNLESFSELRCFNLCNTKTFGGLENIQRLIKLEKFYLNNTNITGEISDLKPFINLVSFNLGNTIINGDIYFLINLPKLVDFDLSSTNIYGDIEIINNLLEIKFFRLNNTNVSGSINNLILLKELVKCWLNNTRITGDKYKYYQLRKSKGLQDCKIFL